MNKRVLVIDDHADVRRLIATLCAKSGYTVTEAADGASAMSAAETDVFQAVVLDLRLPDITGRDLLHRLVTMRPQLSGRILIVTASAEPAAWSHLTAEGACRVVTKPFDPKLLLAALELCAGPDDTVTRRTRRLSI